MASDVSDDVAADVVDGMAADVVDDVAASWMTWLPTTWLRGCRRHGYAAADVIRDVSTDVIVFKWTQNSF